MWRGFFVSANLTCFTVRIQLIETEPTPFPCGKPGG